MILWLLGPRAPETGLYVQMVGSQSAVLSLTEAGPRALEIWLRPASAELGEFRSGYPLPLHWARARDPEPRRQRHWALRGLRSGTSYRYELRHRGAEDAGPQGAVLASGGFDTAPARRPKSDRRLQRLVLFGDSGQLPWWHNMRVLGWDRLRPLLSLTQTLPQERVAAAAAALQPQVLVHLGDLCYWPQIRPAMEDAFFRPLAPLLQRCALLTVPGNHDIPKDGSRPPFEDLFRNPGPSMGAPQRNWTAVWGNLRLVAFDVTQPDWGPGKPIVNWLERVLAGSAQPWLVVIQHQPCFSVYRPENPGLRDLLWPIYQRYGVNLVISGDDHHYARFKSDADLGPVQVISGGGGKRLYDFEAGDPRLAASRKALHFVCLETQGPQLRLRAIDLAGQAFDDLTMTLQAAALPAGYTKGRRARIEKLLR